MAIPHLTHPHFFLVWIVWSAPPSFLPLQEPLIEGVAELALLSNMLQYLAQLARHMHITYWFISSGVQKKKGFSCKSLGKCQEESHGLILARCIEKLPINISPLWFIITVKFVLCTYYWTDNRAGVPFLWGSIPARFGFVIYTYHCVRAKEKGGAILL